jgi:predicted small secreted protein
MRAENTITMTALRRPRCLRRAAAVIVLVALCAWAVTACGQSDSASGSGSDLGSGNSSGSLEGGIGSGVTVGDAVITVKSLQAAFQPVSPPQRLSTEALVAPAAGVTFYQAYVRVENRGQFPLRIDAQDFVCRIGNTLSTLELTRSGPAARSIIFGTSLDLVLTFRGVAGVEPTLVYSPTWYSGIISFSAKTQSQGTATTGTTQIEPATTEATVQ